MGLSPPPLSPSGGGKGLLINGCVTNDGLWSMYRYVLNSNIVCGFGEYVDL